MCLAADLILSRPSVLAASIVDVLSPQRSFLNGNRRCGTTELSPTTIGVPRGATRRSRAQAISADSALAWVRHPSFRKSAILEAEVHFGLCRIVRGLENLNPGAPLR